MAENDYTGSMGKYLEDLKVIRDVLQKHEEKGLLEPWAYFLWGGIVAAASLLHYILRDSLTVPVLYIWTPAVIIGALQETIAWLRKMDKEAVPVLGKRFIRFSLSMLAIFVALILLTIGLYNSGGLTPAMIFFLVSILLVLYAQASFSALYIEAFLLLVIGVVLFAAGFRSPAAYLFTGLFIAAVFIAGGIHSQILEKKFRG